MIKTVNSLQCFVSSKPGYRQSPVCNISMVIVIMPLPYKLYAQPRNEFLVVCCHVALLDLGSRVVHIVGKYSVAQLQLCLFLSKVPIMLDLKYLN